MFDKKKVWVLYIYDDDRRYCGRTAAEIIEKVKNTGFSLINHITVKRYAELLAKAEFQIVGRKLHLNGKTTEDKCRNLINQAVKTGLWRLVKAGSKEDQKLHSWMQKGFTFRPRRFRSRKIR